jgi:hypothetical protein
MFYSKAVSTYTDKAVLSLAVAARFGVHESSAIRSRQLALEHGQAVTKGPR